MNDSFQNKWKSLVLSSEALSARVRAQEQQLTQFIGSAAYMKQWVDPLRHYHESQQRFESQLAQIARWPTSQDTLAGALAVTSSTTQALERAVSALSVSPGTISIVEGLQRSYDREMRSLTASADLMHSVHEAMKHTAAAHDFARLLRAQDAFSTVSSSIYSQLAAAPAGSVAPSKWLAAAPAVELYSSARTLAIVSATPLDLDATEDEVAERELTTAIDELEQRLASISGDFVPPYRGALTAVATQPADWHRHASTSLRELVGHLLQRLAPEDVLRSFFSDPAKHMENGRFTRKAQLRYIFRDVAWGEYECMAEKDIDMALASFYPSNAAVHTLVTPFSDHQIRVLHRRMQGCISVILEAAGY